MKKQLYRPQDLKDFMIRFFTRLNVPAADAEIAADILLEADLRGVDSHGIIRLNTYYGNRLKAGLVNPNTPFNILQETASTLSIDAGNGLGQVVSYRAMQRCIEKAKTANICMATVRSSNHYGIAGYYAMMALPHDMIGISFTNAQSLVAPTYGSKALLGTNPIAVAAPGAEERPYV
ncbi:malate dehydrogenase, partial [bacterium]|nr:malate dehydrogenase [bacterium]